MTFMEACSLADGCYTLSVFDAMGDGMFSGTMGGYYLMNAAGDRIIDNEMDGDFGALSAISGSGEFCVPIGGNTLRSADCGKLDFEYGDVIVAKANLAVAAEYGVGDQSDDGFQFWFFDPDGSYQRRIFMSHASPTTGIASGPYAANHLRLAAWST